MSFEVGPPMPRPTAPHPPEKVHLPGVTPPPLGRRDQPDPWHGRYILFPLLLLIMFAGAAAWAFRYPLLRYMISPDQSTWPTVMATVTATRVETSGLYELSDNSLYRHRTDSRYRIKGHVPEVDFTFAEGAMTYSGSTLAFLPRVYAAESDAQRVLADHPEKSQLLIHCNPQDPSDNIVDQARSDLVGSWSDAQRY